jgi:putative transposase
MNWKRMLAYVTGSVDEELLARNEYLVTENRILRNQIKGRIRLTDPERISLAEVAKSLGRDWGSDQATFLLQIRSGPERESGLSRILRN